MAIQEQTKAPSTTTAHATTPKHISTEIVLESTLIVLVGAVFTYMLVDSLGWHPDVARLPRIASGAGLIVLALYVARRLRTWGQVSERGRILDLGFDEAGLDRRTILSRTVRFVSTTTALFLGCWLIGFHTAIPLYVFGYLVVWGKVRWYWALLAAACFVAYMVVAYDVAIHAQWPEPLFGPFDK
jgi:hypothetical protein